MAHLIKWIFLRPSCWPTTVVNNRLLSAADADLALNSSMCKSISMIQFSKWRAAQHLIESVHCQNQHWRLFGTISSWPAVPYSSLRKYSYKVPIMKTPRLNFRQQSAMLTKKLWGFVALSLSFGELSASVVAGCVLNRYYRSSRFH